MRTFIARWLTPGIIALLLTTAPATARAQWAGPITFHGCDGVRSCHTMQFFATYVDIIPGEMYVVFRGQTTWNTRGAFSDCGDGCAWNTNFPPGGGGFFQDLRHASATCWSYIDHHSYAQPVMAVGNPCDAGTLDPWGGWGFRAPLDWRPQVASVNVAYTDGDVLPGNPPVVTPVTVNLALSPFVVVPEPSTLAMLVVAGCVTLLAAWMQQTRRKG